MNDSEWELVEFLSHSEFEKYIESLEEDERSSELESYGKYYSFELLKEAMLCYDCFYSFIKDYSPCDYKIINRKQYVSQRVIVKHIHLWNEVHTTKLSKIRVFIF